jgi:hypothetical protein
VGDRCFALGVVPSLKVGGVSVAYFTHDKLATDPFVVCHDLVMIRKPPWLPQRVVGAGADWT